MATRSEMLMISVLKFSWTSLASPNKVCRACSLSVKKVRLSATKNSRLTCKKHTSAPMQGSSVSLSSKPSQGSTHLIVFHAFCDLKSNVYMYRLLGRHQKPSTALHLVCTLLAIGTTQDNSRIHNYYADLTGRISHLHLEESQRAWYLFKTFQPSH